MVGCVADNNATYLGQALRLLRSWRWFAGSYSDAPFCVCVVDEVSMESRLAFERLGARVHVVPRFAERHPTSNKIRFFSVPDLHEFDRVVLLDCDTVVVQPPHGLFGRPGLTAKIADVDTVSLELFSKLFTRFNMDMPPADHHCTVNGAPMIPYFNSGVLSFTGEAATAIFPAWDRINAEISGCFEELGGTPHFCEQASLALALAQTLQPYHLVGNELNFPAHFRELPMDSPTANADPAIIHYHFLVEVDGTLAASRYPHVNRRIQAFNQRLVAERGSARG